MVEKKRKGRPPKAEKVVIVNLPISTEAANELEMDYLQYKIATNNLSLGKREFTELILVAGRKAIGKGTK